VIAGEAACRKSSSLSQPLGLNGMSINVSSTRVTTISVRVSCALPLRRLCSIATTPSPTMRSISGGLETVTTPSSPKGALGKEGGGGLGGVGLGDGAVLDLYLAHWYAALSSRGAAAPCTACSLRPQMQVEVAPVEGRASKVT